MLIVLVFILRKNSSTSVILNVIVKEYFNTIIDLLLT